MRQATLPLDASAVKVANAAMASTTGGRPLTMGLQDAELRKQWMDAYVAAGGPIEPETPPKAVGEIIQACPLAAPPPPYDCQKDPPKSCPIGGLDYYQCRQSDFLRRHPTPPPSPPSYYLEYGDKYVRRFSALGGNDLSPEGLAWRDAALRNLQKAVEKKRLEGGCDFNALEEDEGAFQSFAYDTHVNAYLDAGLLRLPLQDLTSIGLTPDVKDLLSSDGLRQVAEVLKRTAPSDVGNVLGSTVESAKESAVKAVQEVWKNLY